MGFYNYDIFPPTSCLYVVYKFTYAAAALNLSFSILGKRIKIKHQTKVSL